MRIVGFNRGVMEGKQWCRAQVLEHFTNQSPDQMGDRAVDASASYALPDMFRQYGYALPFEGDVLVDITPTKKGASMVITAVLPPAKK